MTPFDDNEEESNQLLTVTGNGCRFLWTVENCQVDRKGAGDRLEEAYLLLFQ